MHTPSGYSLFTNCSFDLTKNKLDCYRSRDCMKKFCKDLKEHTTRIINYQKQRNDAANWLTDEENKSYERQNVFFTYAKKKNNKKNK